MPAVQRMGDSNDAGGQIDEINQSTVFANGLLISIDGSLGTDHAGDPRGSWTTANGIATVTIGGVPVNVEGNQDTCTHVRVGGSPDVNIG